MHLVPRPPPLVLLIHDHTNVVDLIQYLVDSGLRVADSHNDVDMVAKAVEIKPDIIVLDFNMDGDIVSRLKGDARTQAIPLIALTQLTSASGRGVRL
jgi:DNA-binding response OmpR family regulator